MGFTAWTVGSLYAFCLVTQPFITVPVTLYALKTVWGTGSLIGKGAYYIATTGSEVFIDVEGDEKTKTCKDITRDDEWVLVNRSIDEAKKGQGNRRLKRSYSF